MSKNYKEAKILETEELYKGRVFKLQREKVTLPNGLTVSLDVIRHPGASAIVPMKDAEHVVLIRQYRHAAGGFILEIPAGTLDGPQEDPFDCAKRELQEETGFSAENFRKLGEIFPVPGYSDEKVTLFLATGLKKAEQNLDHDEVLDVEIVPFQKALDMISDGSIVDAKTIVGLMLARSALQTEL